MFQVVHSTAGIEGAAHPLAMEAAQSQAIRTASESTPGEEAVLLMMQGEIVSWLCMVTYTVPGVRSQTDPAEWGTARCSDGAPVAEAEDDSAQSQ